MDVRAILKSQPPRYRNRLVDYDVFYLIVVQRGRLYYEDAQMSTAIRPGGMVVLRRGSNFDLHTRHEGYAGVALSVIPAEEPPFRGPSTVLGTTPEISQIASWIASELQRPAANSEQIVDGLARSLIGHGLRRLRDHRGGDEPGESLSCYWASRAASAIASALYTDRNIEQILSELEPSHRQIARYMKGEYGRSPKQYQIDLKIGEAQRLLEHTRFTVTTIALELGFPSVQHFSAQFRRQTGHSPSAMQKKLESQIAQVR